VEHGFGPGAGRVAAEVLYRLEVLGEGIAERRRFTVEGAGIVGVGPVGFGRDAKQHHRPHGGAEVGASIAAELHQVVGDLVEEKARGVEMTAKSPPFVVFDEADAGMSRAGTEEKTQELRMRRASDWRSKRVLVGNKQ